MAYKALAVDGAVTLKSEITNFSYLEPFLNQRQGILNAFKVAQNYKLVKGGVKLGRFAFKNSDEMRILLDSNFSIKK